MTTGSNKISATSTGNLPAPWPSGSAPGRGRCGDRSDTGYPTSTGAIARSRGSTSCVNSRMLLLEFLVRHVARPADQREVPEPADLVIELHDLPIDAVGIAGEQDPLLPWPPVR